jgi:uncharacterized protein YlaI
MVAGGAMEKTLDCGVKCAICGKVVLFEDDGSGPEQCTLLVPDAFICDKCQETVDRAEMQRAEDSFDAWIKMMEDGFKDAAALASDVQESEVERAMEDGAHEDWLDLQETLEDARRL